MGALALADVAAAQEEAQAIVNGAVNASELTLEASYSLSVTAFTAETVTSDVAGLADAQAAAEADFFTEAEQAIVAGAANAEDVTVSVPYALEDTLANLEGAAEGVVEGAESYTLTETEFTAEAVESSVAELADAQADAEANFLQQAIVAGAANAEDVTVTVPYSLNDDADLLLAADADVLAGADVVTVNNETLTREQFDALNALENVNLNLEGVEVENTAPEAVEATAEVAEDATFEGQLEATDPDVADQGDELTFALAEGQEEVAGFTLNADGSYSFDAAQEAFQALQAGDTQDVVINYTVTDSEGATSTNTLTLTVTGTDDAPVVAIADGTENDLLATQVFGAEDAITDVDGFGGSATVTLAYGEAVSVANDNEFGRPTFKGATEFRVVRDGNSFTLIAEGGENGFEADTAIGTVTPVGLANALDAEGDVIANEYTVTGYTLELNDNVTPEVLTALLQEWNVQQAEDGSNTQLTVSIASEGGAEPVEFVRNIKGEDGGNVTLTDAETDPLEAELTAGALATQSADVPFTAFGELDLDVGDDNLINGMTIKLSSTNSADKFTLQADSEFEIVNGQLILIADARVVADVTGIGSSSVVVTFRSDAGLTEGQVENQLIEKLLLDLEDAIGERTVDLSVTSGDSLSEASLSREISVLGEFTEVSLTAIQDADIATDAESAVTVDGNTILNIGSFDGELDIQAQIDAGNLILGESNTIRLVASADADLSEVVGLELLGDLQIQTVETGTLTLTAAQVDFLATAGEVDGSIAVLALEENLDADLSVLEAASVTAAISADAGDVTFTGDFGTAEVTVGANSTLTATAALLSEVTVNGAVVVTDLDGEAAYNLAGLDNATATLAAETVTTLNEDTKLGTVAVTVPQNSELVLTAAQANGAGITGGQVNGTDNKGGSVTVLGLADDVNLNNINVSKVLAGAVNATQSDLIVTFRAEDEEANDGVITGVDLGEFNVQVEEGATLRIDEQANGAIITGAGNVEVYVDAEGPLGLSEITVGGDKTVEVIETVDLSDETIDLGQFAVNVAAEKTLTLTAEQADGVTITGDSRPEAQVNALQVQGQSLGGSVEVELDGAAAYNLANITAGAESAEEADDAGTLTATVANDAVLNTETDLGDFSVDLDGADVDLTLTAAQAAGRKITGTDDDSVTVNGLAADTDLSKIDSAIDVTANVAESIDISANESLKDVVDTFVVANDAVLTLSARQADDQVVNPAVDDADEATAAPAVVISGSLEALDEDLENIGEIDQIDFRNVAADFTFEGGSLEVGEGVTVTLTAAQADGKVITGAGNVAVAGLGDAAVDLSGITVDGVMLARVEDDVDQAVVLSSATDLGDFGIIVENNNTLTMTAAQANALTTLTGAEGKAIINGTVAGETLDFSAKSDWTIGTLTINGGGGADVLTAPENVANVTLNGGSNGDTFNVASGTVTIGDFTPGVDELVIAADATATITLTADTDLTDAQVAALLSNEGALNVNLNGFNLTATREQLSDAITTTGEGSVLLGGDLGDLTIDQVSTQLGFDGFSENAEYSIVDELVKVLTEQQAGSAILSNANSITITDLASGSEEVTFTGLTAEAAPTTINFVDDAATLTADQLGSITADTGANLALTPADAITVTGVTDTTLIAVDDELDSNDTIEVDDNVTIELTVADLNDLSSTIKAEADGVGTDATVAVNVAAGESATRATDLVDTFDVSALTDGQSATIAGLAVNDVISTGVTFAGTEVISNNNSVEWAFDAVSSTLTYELTDNGSTTTTASVVLTGVASVTEANGVFTVDSVA